VITAEIVTFSGDKLLGGPQAGFIVGKRDLIQAINRNPMKRALRVDKIRLAAIEATLKLYRDPIRLAERLPTLRMLTRSRQEIEAQARRMLPHMAEALGENFAVELCECQSQIGSGALPLETIASAGLAIAAKRKGPELERLSAMLRELPRPVIGRIEKERLVLDLRCADEEEALLSNLGRLNAIAQNHAWGALSDDRLAKGAPP
jgi:L-seryl-tRNA(Ser) seleniumtransferase